MPIPPSPTTYSCPACHWSKTVAPRSDALMPAEFFGACPRCRHAPLDRKTASLAQATLGGLADAFKRLW